MRNNSSIKPQGLKVNSKFEERISEIQSSKIANKKCKLPPYTSYGLTTYMTNSC